MKGKKVLVVPLNWGLGHTTRIIPIIRLLQEKKAEVFVSCSKEQIALLTSEFKDLKIVSLPVINVKIAANNQVFSYLLQMPKFLKQIISEHRALNDLLKKEPFDLIISDNCYGLWNKRVRSIIITHQINLIVPKVLRFIQPVFNCINRKLIRNFSACWIPDFQEEPNLSGNLSHPLPANVNARYIGPLTRFSNNEFFKLPNDKNDHKHILFIISGPEKQRTLFENILINQASKLKPLYKCTFIRGLLLHHSGEMPENHYNHLPSEKMFLLINQADFVVCRSGYSSIMDLTAMNKSTIFVPTPGQTEQEYLAKHISHHKPFVCQVQDKIDIAEGIKMLETKSAKTKMLNIEKKTELLKCELEKLLGAE